MTNNAKRPSFADVKAVSLKEIDRVLAHWLPNGKRVDGGKEYTAANPTRADKRAGSLKVNLSKGTWADFATGDKGGDLIDLVRYLDGGTDVEACNKLADLLHVTAGAAQSKPTPAKAKHRNGWQFGRSRPRPLTSARPSTGNTVYRPKSGCIATLKANRSWRSIVSIWARTKTANRAKCLPLDLVPTSRRPNSAMALARSVGAASSAAPE